MSTTKAHSVALTPSQVTMAFVEIASPAPALDAVWISQRIGLPG